MKEIVKAYETMLAFFNHIFKYENPVPEHPNESMIYVAREYFERATAFYEKLYAIEQK